MDSVFNDDISIIAQETLEQDDEEEDWVDSPNTEQSGDMCSASHFALITAYSDIKERLSTLERENVTLRRRLKVYEGKYPIISEFGDDQNFSLYDSKEDSLLRTDASQQELQNSQENEKQLGEMVRACEKICAERCELHEELSEMKGLVLTHVAHIQSLEQQLQLCTEPHPFPGSVLSDPDMQYLSLHRGPEMPNVLEHPMTWQAPRSLDLQRDVVAQRRDAELEEARRELQNAQRREKQLKEDVLRLEEELKRLQETREQVLATGQTQREMAWLKEVGDDQVNLALAYTELTEELYRLRDLTALQSRILRNLLEEQTGQRHSPPHRHSPCPLRHSPSSIRHSPSSQRRSPIPQCPSPILQRRSPAPQSPAHQRRSPVPPSSPSRRSPIHTPCPPVVTELSYPKPPTHQVKASFQARRSYSEISEPTLYTRAPRSLWLPPGTSTLPKQRSYIEGYTGSPPASSCFHDPPQQSSDEDEWSPPSPPSPEPGAVRCASFCAGFPIPDIASRRMSASYSRSEHAQSWPSINLLMETVDSEVRSCPLCQLAFPVGYPDDVLIKHIDSHLENSKI
ncbi:TANK-binding kinase 1-binding protein 1 [Bombina bombina]|uniref:TANK-binding kinase 1-binding protein 1 n=1 Tax=Bombina bombina TaxID=8345 RepID=UPI00235AAF1B|nr:TANK-binding kinase 1-binding protein 1 [Bombina bombina]